MKGRRRNGDREVVRWRMGSDGMGEGMWWNRDWKVEKWGQNGRK